MLLLRDGVNGEEVNVGASPPDFPDDCNEGPPHIYFFINVWNRTGLAAYVEHELQRPLTAFTFNVTLPPEPPYLVRAGTECSFTADVEFRGNDYLLTSTAPANNPNWPGMGPQLAQDVNRSVLVTIPLGQTHGEAFLPVYGHDFGVQYGFLGGFIDREGSKYGEFAIHDFDQRPLWGSRFATSGHEFWQDHQRTGWNGDYLVTVDLETPALLPTTWSAWGRVDSFVPALADYGFQVPFAPYDQDPAP